MESYGFLSEGLREGDLEYVVKPLISVDEYDPKISSIDNIIVTAFFVDNEEAGKDLSNFIDRSVHDILDSEVSPAPNKAGEYIVFVEIERNKDYPMIIDDLLGELTRLTAIHHSEWEMIVYGDKKRDYDIKRLRKLVDFELKKPDEKQIHETILRKIFKQSMLNNLIVNNEVVVLEGFNYKEGFEFISFDRKYDTPLGDFDTKSLLECSRIEQALGHKWSVKKDDDVICIENTETGDFVALNKLNS